MNHVYDDEFDAIASAIGASGKKFGAVAMFMFPDMRVESAYAKLKACVNPAGDQRLTFGQVLRLMRYCECFDPLYYGCDQTLHARPDRKAVADEAVKLAEVMHHAAQIMERATNAMNQLRAAAALKNTA